MTRLSLFDFEPAETEFCTVAELTGRIKSALERGFSEIALRGEISNLARPRSGHVYLNLKDDSASIRAVLWKTEAQRLVFELADGLAVKVWGKLSVYAPRGEYQVTIRRIEPEGIGALELAFRQTVARLAAEGLFDPARKKPLPRFPRRIVVVTSPTGAAVRDLIQVTGRRWPMAEILIAPAKMQGLGAAEEIAAALALADRVAGADFIIVARGGGSLEDLWAFNEEVVARAIAGCAAAGRLGRRPRGRYDRRRPRGRPPRARPRASPARSACPTPARSPSGSTASATGSARAGRARIDQARAALETLSDRAGRALRRTLDDRRHRLARLAAGLEALSPLGVLARGYSLTFRADDGALVRSPDDVRPGDLIRTRLASGEVFSRVEPAG